MSTFHLRIPKNMLPVPLLHRAFFAACGRVPTFSEVTINDDILSVYSEMPGSGTIHFPWPNKRLGLIFINTETLIEREKPYHLLKELGRGQLGRVIRRFVELVYFGFKPSERIRRALRLEVARFAMLATSNENSEEIDKLATDSINRLVQLGLVLNDMFLEQSLAFRKKITPLFPVKLGISTDIFLHQNPVEHLDVYSDHLKEVFHHINATPSWRELEPRPNKFYWELFEERIDAAERNDFSIIGGPIIKFDFRSVPTWVLDNLEEEGALEQAALKYVDSFLEHFANKADLWILASQINSQLLDHCPMYRIIELTKRIVTIFAARGFKQKALVSVDQPWGDYLLYKDTPYTPYNLAENLAGLPGLSAILLDVNIGLSGRCSYPRDPLALSAMIDQWSYFGKPLYLSLGFPSELGANPELPDEFISDSFEWSKKTQQEWMHSCLPILFSKRIVEGVLWNQLEDSEYSECKSIGLFDSVGRLKPAFRKLAAYRNAYIE